jgi:hypothetical protein
MTGLVGGALQRRMGPGIEGRTAPARGAAPGGGTPGVDPAGQDGEDPPPNVTPAEQQAYEDFVKHGLALIYGGGKVRPAILELLDENPKDLIDAPELKDFTPSVALAATATVVVLELVRRAGDRRPDDAIVLHGGKALLEDLAHLAGEAKIHDFTQEELNRSFYLACDLYRDAAAGSGLIDLSQLKAEFEEVKAADAEGRLGALFAGQAPADRRTAPPAAAPATGRGGGDVVRG